MTTEERIIDNAATLFSRKGYKNTTISEIANGAKVNRLTVFRHFHDKDTLFFKAVEYMKRNVFSPEKLNEKLTFQNIQDDLMTIGTAYADEIYASLPLIRIYIGEGMNYDQLKDERWFISPALKQHFYSYIQELDCACQSAKEHADLLSEIFVSYITRKVMSHSKSQNIWQKTPEFDDHFRQSFPPVAQSIAFMLINK